MNKSPAAAQRSTSDEASVPLSETTGMLIMAALVAWYSFMTGVEAGVTWAETAAVGCAKAVTYGPSLNSVFVIS